MATQLSSAADCQPGGQRVSRRVRNLERDGPAGLLLDHRRALAQGTAWSDVADSEPHEIATAQFRVDAAVEQGEVAYPTSRLQLLTDRPHVPGLAGRLGSYDATRDPRCGGRTEGIALCHVGAPAKDEPLGRRKVPWAARRRDTPSSGSWHRTRIRTFSDRGAASDFDPEWTWGNSLGLLAPGWRPGSGVHRAGARPHELLHRHVARKLVHEACHGDALILGLLDQISQVIPVYRCSWLCE